jgi:hypothetical protein
MTASHFSRAAELLSSARTGLMKTYDLPPEQFIALSAAIGAGYAQLAIAEQLDELLHKDLSLQEQDQLRQRRAAAEARPHDGEQPVKTWLADNEYEVVDEVGPEVTR